MFLKLEAIVCLERLRLLGSFNCWGLGEIGYSSYLFFLAQHAEPDTRGCILISSLRQDGGLKEAQSEWPPRK